MATLRHWLDDQKIKPEAFAGLLCVHWVTVYKWMKGTSRPSFAKLGEIERITDGAITARNLASDCPKGKEQDCEAVLPSPASPAAA